jgi:DNA invertase Pin-like site-specific DNA recombinase
MDTLRNISPGELIGYCRTSTTSQTLASQIDALEEAGCSKIFSDHGVTGAAARRPGFDECLAYLRPGDTLVVYSLSRAGRSLKNLIELVGELEERQVNFKSLTEQLSTDSAQGRLTFHLFAALAAFQRELIVEATQSGLAAARARGRVGGRPRALTDTQVKLVREMYDTKEYSVKSIAEAFNVSRKTIYRCLEGRDSLLATGV